MTDKNELTITISGTTSSGKYRRLCHESSKWLWKTSLRKEQQQEQRAPIHG